MDRHMGAGMAHHRSHRTGHQATLHRRDRDLMDRALPVTKTLGDPWYDRSRDCSSDDE